MIKPNLFLVGASKCGSTFLHHALDQHPEICMSKVKEPWFFSWDDYRDKFDWYYSLFDHCSGATYAGESSPIYSETTYFPDIPARIYQFNPEARLIYIVREPFSRLESVYKQTMSSGHWAEKKFYKELMPRDYSSAVFQYPPFLEATKYWTHIQNFLKFFPEEQLKVVLFEDLVRNFNVTMEGIVSFLNVSAYDFLVDSSSKNESKGKKIYNAKFKKFSNALPVVLKDLVPESVKRGIFDVIHKRSENVPDSVQLSAQDVVRVREVLAPEVEGLYKFLEIEGDPWGWWGGR